jgi:rhodanese-related sulfurtransferase
MKEITVQELNECIQSKEDFVLVDVREPLEIETGNLGGKQIPMGEILNRLHEIPTDKKVVIHCKAGGRSANVIRYLSAEKGFQNLYNLTGGILAWKNEIDPSIDVL